MGRWPELQPPETAPLDGWDFLYVSQGQWRIGSLGGNIRRDPEMVCWCELPPLPSSDWPRGSE